MTKEEENSETEPIDKLSRTKFVHRLTDSIDVDFQFQEESYVLFLTGKYGSGKSTLLHMWKQHLTAHGYKVALINAWETGFEESPIIPILSELYDILPKSESMSNIKTAIPYLAVAASALTSVFTGIDAMSVCDQLDTVRDNLAPITQKIFDSFNNRRKAIETLKNSLKYVCAHLDGKPLYIFIDELDRVRPDYAIAYLEVIKHFFSVRGVVFVIATDKDQLYSSIRHHFGFQDAHGYLLRFITREATIPECTLVDLCCYIDDVLNKNFHNRKITKIVNIRIVIEYFATLGISFKLTLREIQMIVRVLTHYMQIDTNTDDFHLTFGGVLAIIFMLCLYQHNIDKYHAFGAQKINVTIAWNYIHDRIDVSNELVRNNIISIILLAMSNRDTRDEIDKLPVNADIKQLMTRPWEFYEGGFDSRRDKSVFRYIYTKLQGWFRCFEQIPNF